MVPKSPSNTQWLAIHYLWFQASNILDILPAIGTYKGAAGMLFQASLVLNSTEFSHPLLGSLQFFPAHPEGIKIHLGAGVMN
jgi:hypothetical protein